VQSAAEFPRLLGAFGGEAGAEPGPLLLILGGVHGNEPAGAHAARAVLAELAARRTPLRGRVVALAGNRAALRANRRYLARDLNRLWSAAELEALRVADEQHDDVERREQRELLAALQAELARPHTRAILLDLHSTSAGGAPFGIMADTLQNRVIAFALGVPVILGLEERIEGTLLAWFSERGDVAVCVEGGQNQAGSTVEHHVAAIWLALLAGGLVDERDVPEGDALRERLARATAGLPAVVELTYRYGVQPDEAFEMLPGFSNFQAVARDDLVAHGGLDGTRDVRAPRPGLLLMPRYQGQGDDGFFLGQRVHRFWLSLSAALRRARLAGVLGWLPGVQRVDGDPRVLRADPRVARWRLLDAFHLFGYRRARRADGWLVFVRRPDLY
jgi:succinylglutamate desuccinylase